VVQRKGSSVSRVHLIQCLSWWNFCLEFLAVKIWSIDGWTNIW